MNKLSSFILSIQKTQAVLDWFFSLFIFAFTFILFITPKYIQDSAAVIFTVYEFDQIAHVFRFEVFLIFFHGNPSKSYIIIPLN
ncbi:hypothetical protein QFZ73_002780 [Peribacillus sp. V2I11]|nr:hypothetical protein [Peribacillus sp. V2I11]